MECFQKYIQDFFYRKPRLKSNYFDILRGFSFIGEILKLQFAVQNYYNPYMDDTVMSNVNL